MEDTKCIFILTKVIKFHFSVLVICTICVPTASEAGCKVYNSTHVDCTYRRLTAVPSNLPSSTTHLDLSYNEITRLKPGCLENLHSLEELIMTIFEDLIIDVNAFEGLHNLRSLSFPGPGSVIFNKGTFRCLSRLQTLEIQIKTFVNIPDDLFSNLINLSKLTIRRPAVDVKYSRAVFLPRSLFRGLDNLEELAVVGSVGSSLANFSSESFKDLVRLKIIDFDIYHLKCDDIEKLRLLKNVEVIRFRSFTNATTCNLTFSQFPRLKEVIFDFIDIRPQFSTFDWSKNCSHYSDVHMQWDKNGQEAGTLPPLSPYNVFHLNITIVRLDVQLECYLNGLRNLAIHSLTMIQSLAGVYNFTETTFQSLARSDIHEMDIRFTLDKIATNTFQGLTRLKALYMNECDLRDGTFVSLNASPTLTTLSLASNKFKNLKQLLSALAQLNNLRNIDVSGNRFTGKIPENAFLKHPFLTSINLSGNKFDYIDPRSFSFLSNLQHLDLSYNELDGVASWAFYALKSLDTLLLVGNSLRFQGDTEFQKYPLKNLCNLTMLTLGTSRLETIDLADTPRLENLHIDVDSGIQPNKALFPEHLLLEHLTVLIVKNAKFVSLDRERVIINTEVINLHPRQFLRVLELENNNFNELNFTSLNEFRSLVELSVANNKLTFIHGVPDKLDKLESLDLSGNLIAVFSSEILTHLPSLNILIIYDNPFDCSCKMKPFNDWLRKDEKSYVDFSGPINGHSICSLPRVKYGIPINMVELGFECDLVLLIVLPLTCFTIMVIVIIALVHRFHWHIRFAYFLIKRRLGGYQLQINDEDQPINKQYDAFVVYNKHDSDWVIHELLPNLENIDPPNFKLCIHERNFLPGSDIIENILDSTENSKKSMLILSPDFAASEWCYFEMRMAQHCLFEEKRDIIVMVLLKKIPDDDMPQQNILRNILLTKSYLEWPENEMGRRLFWEKLKVALRSDSKVNRVANL